SAPAAPGAPGEANEGQDGAPGGGPPGPPNTSSNRRLQQSQAQVEEVVDIMRVNVEKVLERDQKLSELDERANALEAGASQFESSAAKLKSKYWWKNCKFSPEVHHCRGQPGLLPAQDAPTMKEMGEEAFLEHYLPQGARGQPPWSGVEWYLRFRAWKLNPVVTRGVPGELLSPLMQYCHHTRKYCRK
ncbi:SYB protein, partial [Polypterus senegalus]